MDISDVELPRADVAQDDDDLAAELDDDPTPDELAVPDSPDDPAPLFEGIAQGGPWDGRQIQTRCPKGFLLVDMPTRRLWIYDLSEDGKTYVVRGDGTAGELRDDGDVNRWRAVDEGHYDVRVLDEDDDQQGAE